MFLNNSYFNVLRKIDNSWDDKPLTSGRSRTKKWREKFSRSNSSKSSRSLVSSNSVESGTCSEDANSGYYGDDEIEPCLQCRAADFPLRSQKANIEEYDVISIEVNVRHPRRNGSSCRHSNSVNFDEFVVIPSSREEFCAGKFKQSTPKAISNRTLGSESSSTTSPHILVTCTPKIVSCATPLSDAGPMVHSPSCTCCTPQKPVRFRLDAPSRSSFADARFWWRENITWQLRQRNKTQTANFAELQETGPHSRVKVKINRDIAHFLNSYGEFRPHNEFLNTALVEMEGNALYRADLVEAIRLHGGGEEELSGDGLASLAQAYIRKQSTKANPPEETDDESRQFVQRQSKKRMHTRLFVPRWKESITNQIQMRNILECKYFTDAIVRRSLQVNVSVSVSTIDESQTMTEIEDYDVISSDETTQGTELCGKALNSSQSTSQGYHSAPTPLVANGSAQVMVVP
ncbi:uncharacterized protein LOC5511866 [Nematostella vectensis]|uniref:uncharacterized protein LOC5511866 n=1 Tax=Nematostella vectensis TaxID=45351 RepID=UPI0020775A11|nr:uncharacterized protein LOC5511866 [Nematostella vectensis]